MLDKWNQIYKFGVNGWFNYQELYDMVCERYDSGPFVEIGVWQGMSLSYLTIKAKHQDVWGIDTFKGDPHNPNEQRLIKDGGLNLQKITELNFQDLGITSKLIIKDSIEASKHFLDSECTFVFIDGGHMYEQVMKDLNAWYPKVKFGGIIGGHDYDTPGVHKAIHDFFGAKINNKGDYWWIER